jgi:1-deoxy-D-xylulose-5-phosphate reductoisomerase
MKNKIAILGSTGSIGKSLINILRKDKKNFEIVLLTTNKNLKELIKQINIFKVKNVIISNKKTFLRAKKIYKNKKINIYENFDNLKFIFKNKKIDYVMSSISGLAGLKPTINVIEFCKILAIANKESIICAWDLIKKRLNKFKTKFIPVDSEHFSIWSLLNKNDLKCVKKIHITASGGPFINYNLNRFKKIKIKDALKHPNWSMGKKISIDSATMMNKVFEVIETNRIFDIDYKNISILSHEKSYLHAIVELNNGLIKFLVHETDMKIPIFNSLYKKNEKTFLSKNLNINYMNSLNLKKIDLIKFPVIKILTKYPKTNTLFDTVIITINDNLVDLFLKRKISFIDISKNLLNLSKFKEFQKYRKIKPKNVNDIYNLKNYVSLKMTTLGI